MTSEKETARQPEPPRPRAMFSTEDFELIRAAIGSYLQDVEDQDQKRKYANLFHRLGRIATT